MCPGISNSPGVGLEDVDKEEVHLSSVDNVGTLHEKGRNREKFCWYGTMLYSVENISGQMWHS